MIETNGHAEDQDTIDHEVQSHVIVISHQNH